jgi:hypothetical protein
LKVGLATGISRKKNKDIIRGNNSYTREYSRSRSTDHESAKSDTIFKFTSNKLTSDGDAKYEKDKRKF